MYMMEQTHQLQFGSLWNTRLAPTPGRLYELGFIFRAVDDYKPNELVAPEEMALRDLNGSNMFYMRDVALASIQDGFSGRYRVRFPAGIENEQGWYSLQTKFGNDSSHRTQITGRSTSIDVRVLYVYEYEL